MKITMRSKNGVNITQLVGGILFLFTGLIIYLLVRGSVLPYIPEVFVVRGMFPASIIHLTNQLPTFTHLLAFALFTAALLGGGRRSAAVVCLFWLFVETVFEAAQHPIVSGWLTLRIPQWLDNMWLFIHLRGFLASGTFDPLDIVAAGVAAILAYGIINLTEARQLLFKLNTSQNTAIDVERSMT